LHDLFLPWKLKEHLMNGVVRSQTHPTLPLTIFNYTEQAQIHGIWDSCTTKCRGLVVDNQQNVIARGFDKFFNAEEKASPGVTWADYIQRYATGVPEVTKKLDGSLGILYRYQGRVGIATRGSFTSDQALWATNWYLKHVSEEARKGWLSEWPEGYTPVFEIIYRANRIVVDYDFEGLVLLALIHNRTGAELNRQSLEVWAFDNNIPVVQKFDKSLAQCAAENNLNEEGYVLTWHGDYRQAPHKVKVKFADYVRLHRIVTGMNPKDVWEMMASGQYDQIKTLLADETMPVGFRQWLSLWANELDDQYKRS
jgi:RNA ligase